MPVNVEKVRVIDLECVFTWCFDVGSGFEICLMIPVLLRTVA